MMSPERAGATPRSTVRASPAMPLDEPGGRASGIARALEAGSRREQARIVAGPAAAVLAVIVERAALDIGEVARRGVERGHGRAMGRDGGEDGIGRGMRGDRRPETGQGS